MKLILDSQPFLLYETVSMIYSYVNDISILRVRDRISRAHRGCYDDTWFQRLGRLQEIMEACCKDLDVDSETIQHFFRQMSTGLSSDYTYLAAILTVSFMRLEKHDLDGEIQTLKDNWKRLQEKGYKLSELGAGGLSILPLEPDDKQQKLSLQVYGLKYPAELRLEILNALMDYDAELDRLGELLRPYAQRLEACLKAEPWLMDSTVAYWRRQFETTTPEEYFRSRSLVDLQIPPLNESRICFSLMDCAQINISYGIDTPGCGIFSFGCATLAESFLHHGDENVDWILSSLRSLCDKNRFELIRRLSREQNYCQKLAEELGCHPGNVSRNLTLLWKEGFLTRKEGENRVYYETDTERIESLLQQVRYLLTGKFSND